MAFDIHELTDYLQSYMDKYRAAPPYVDFYINVSDGLPDNITGDIYNFTLLYQGPDGKYYQ